MEEGWKSSQLWQREFCRGCVQMIRGCWSRDKVTREGRQTCCPAHFPAAKSLFDMRTASSLFGSRVRFRRRFWLLNSRLDLQCTRSLSRLNPFAEIRGSNDQGL